MLYTLPFTPTRSDKSIIVHKEVGHCSQMHRNVLLTY